MFGLIRKLRKKTPTVIKKDSVADTQLSLKFNMPFNGVVSYYPVGSAHVCEPPVDNTDVDWLVLFESKTLLIDNINNMMSFGWRVSGDYPLDTSPTQMWYSLKKGNLNLIVTYSSDRFLRFVAAAALCKAENFTDKNQRIMIHNALISQQNSHVMQAIELITGKR